MPNLKWLFQPSRRMAVTWVALMSGGSGLAREGVLSYFAAVNRPVPAPQVWAILGHFAMGAFIVSGLAVIVGEVQARERAELDLVAVKNQTPVIAEVEPSKVEPPRAYVRETGVEILQRYDKAAWNERDAIFDAVYRGHWIKGTAYITLIEKDRYSLVTVFLGNAARGDFWGTIHIAQNEHHLITHLRKHDRVNFDMRIMEISSLSITLEPGSLVLAHQS